MPVRKIPALANTVAAEHLKTRLVEEWKAPLPETKFPGEAPIILEEGGRGNDPVHLYVVWLKWEGHQQAERSEIIMEAFEEVYGLDATLKVTVAMGLTPAEADRMGIVYQ